MVDDIKKEIDIEKIIKKIDKLPTLPLIVTKLSELIKNPNTSANDIQNIIAKDQALTARILKLVNSAFYGFSERISSMSHAIVILGFNTIKNVALTASVFDMFGKKEEKDVFNKEAFWMHSIAVAGTARVVAKHLRVPIMEDVFIAGLLHDVGKVILDQYLPNEYAKVCALIKEKNCLIAEAEYEVLDFTHSQVGGYLTTHWKLPPGLVQMVGLHHRPELGGDLAKATFCIHLADILVRAMEIGSGGDNKIPIINKKLWEEFGLNEQVLQLIMIDMQNELRDVEQFVRGM